MENQDLVQIILGGPFFVIYVPSNNNSEIELLSCIKKAGIV